jgi:hypothetical protein
MDHWPNYKIKSINILEKNTEGNCILVYEKVINLDFTRVKYLDKAIKSQDTDREDIHKELSRLKNKNTKPNCQLAKELNK